MKKLWLISNSNSGSYDADMCARIGETVVAHGGVFDRCITLPDDDLPTIAEVEAAGVEIVAIFTGDGTINASTRKLEGWGGQVLILPGGTMNLLSKQLHGDVEATDIVARALSPQAVDTDLPVVVGCGQRALVGIIAGPTAAWVDVREDMRALDLLSLAATVPGAIAQTFNGDMVRLAGETEEYQAIYIQPQGDTLEAIGIRAKNPSELVQHGIAWLSGDFRKGPADVLETGTSVTVECDSAIGLLIDGEKRDGTHPCTFTLEKSSLRFIKTLADAPAS